LPEVTSLAVLGLAAGCQPCLEFECGGGFIWQGRLDGEPRTLRVVVETEQSRFEHECVLGEAAAAEEPECSADVERRDPESGEHSTITLWVPEEGPPRWVVSVDAFEPKSAAAVHRTEATGPETVTIEAASDDLVVFEETYSPEYMEQSHGPGCGVCEHEVYEIVDLRG